MAKRQESISDFNLKDMITDDAIYDVQKYLKYVPVSKAEPHFCGQHREEAMKILESTRFEKQSV